MNGQTQASLRPGDSPRGSWVERWWPTRLKPFARLARLDRPVGIWLLMWPCLWSLTLAGEKGLGPDLRLIMLFVIGAILLRSAGCIFNDIVDRDLDAQVERTKGRPLPSGQVSVRSAVVLLAVLLLLGLVVLMQFNTLAIWVGAASLLLVAVYPFAKRFTFWPQILLGMAFNWGALMGWAAVDGRLEPAALLLYMGGIFWTLGYDTIYAHQDRRDDLVAEIKSTAVLLGEASRRWITGFFICTLILLTGAVLAAGGSWPAYMGLAAVAGHAAWQAQATNLANPQECLRAFRANSSFGFIMFAGLVADRMIV